ncbi:MAG: hypothetical protein WAX69_03215 [Victivallales bacterium]
MRNLFIILCNLLGISILYSVVSVLPSKILSYYVSSGEISGMLLFESTAELLISISFVSILFLFSNKIFTALKIKDDDSSLPNYSEEFILKTGLILIGLYFFISDAPYLIKLIYSSCHENLFGEMKIKSNAEITMSALSVIISLCVIFYSQNIASFLMKTKKKQ